jgi:cytochrome c2
MKYYRFNQIAMAVLVALLLFFGTRTLIDIAYEEHKPEKPGYEVAGGEDKPGEDGKPASELAGLLAKGSAEKGAEIAKKCSVCHSFEKGQPSPLGPPLHDVVGRKIASVEGFNYSPALKGKQGEWTYENIDAFITDPQAFAPGTIMAFPGLPDAQQRADVILYLREETENPPPLPKVEEKPEGGAPEGEGGKPGAPAAEGGSEFMAALAKADPKKGEADAALCKVCHTFDKGGATLIGPNLYGVVGHKIASHEGVNYTPALKAKEGEWTFENLDQWLTNPQAFAAGTSMAFPGVPDVKKRANIVAYLNASSDKPLPIPEGGAQPAEQKPTEEKPGTPGEEKPTEEKPAAPADEKPAEEKPAAPAEEKPAEEKPAAPADEKPAEEKPAEPAPPAGEPEKPAEGQPPAAAEEQAPPPEQKPAAPPEEQAPAEEQAPPAEEKPAPSEAAPPAAEQPPAEEAAPPAEAPPAAEQPAPPAEPPAGEKAAPAPAAPKVEPHPDAEPSKGEEPSPSQPQPVYPDGPDEPAAKEAQPPADTDSPSTSESMAPVEEPDAGTSTGEGPSPSQPQPVYPDGPPEGL